METAIIPGKKFLYNFIYNSLRTGNRTVEDFCKTS